MKEIKQDGPMLEFVRAAVLTDDLRRGVDLLRTRPNETTLVQGQLGTHQLWQRVDFRIYPQSSIVLGLSVNMIGRGIRQGIERLGRGLLVRPGSVVRAMVCDPKASELSLASLEIFGWEVREDMVPRVEEALRALESS